MATVNPTINRALQGAQSVMSSVWNLGNADEGNPCNLIDFADRSVQVQGTFGAATVVIEGSNDGVNYHTLRDPQGVTLSFTQAGLKQVLESCLYIRAKSSGGTGTEVVVTLIGRKADPKSWS